METGMMDIEKRFLKNPDKGKEKLDAQTLVPFLFPSGAGSGGGLADGEGRLAELEVPFDARLFGEQLQHGMKDLFFTNHLSDVTLVVGREGDRIPAHKFVLYAWSPKFQVPSPHIYF
jgi:hypothetical protein